MLLQSIYGLSKVVAAHEGISNNTTIGYWLLIGLVIVLVIALLLRKLIRENNISHYVIEYSDTSKNDVICMKAVAVERVFLISDPSNISEFHKVGNLTHAKTAFKVLGIENEKLLISGLDVIDLRTVYKAHANK